MKISKQHTKNSALNRAFKKGSGTMLAGNSDRIVKSGVRQGGFVRK